MATIFDRPIAHRGLHDRARGVIENSRSAFAAAIEHGFDIELDLQLSADGEAIVFHDDTLERLTGGDGPVRARAADDLTSLPLLGSAAGDTPQRFADMLAEVDGRAMLQVELKHQPTEAMTIALARRAAELLASYRGPATVESFDPRLIHYVRRFGFRGPRGIIVFRYDKPDDGPSSPVQRVALRNLLHWPLTRFDFISCDKQALTLPAVRLFRRRGMPVTCWTIRSPGEATAALRNADQIVFEGFLPA